jgi:two-component system, OmpR family, phosphate regulon response regulator PhoB
VTEDDLAALAHELKTPIAVIAGYAELLTMRNDEETRTAAAEQILAAAQRLSGAVDALLGLDSPAAPRGGPSADLAAATGRRDGRAARIMIVDDDVFVRRLLRLTLPTTEFELAEASDGGIALALVEAQRPDLVLLDWQMPTVPGDEVLPRLKERDPSLPVVVLTAAGEERGHARRLGADAFLTKPFSPLELLRTIEKLLEPRRAERAA